jgi:hypothetical protein
MLCVYDYETALLQGYEVDRAGDPCAGKPCWAAKGTNGLAYKDKLAASDGIAAIKFKGGPSGNGQASAAGANNAGKGQTALPTGVVAALTGNAKPTIQIQTSDGLRRRDDDRDDEGRGRGLQGTESSGHHQGSDHPPAPGVRRGGRFLTAGATKP